MRPTLPWALALLLTAPLSQAAEPGTTSSKSSRSSSASEDSDEGRPGKSGTFLGRIFGKSPDSKSQENQGASSKSSQSTTSKSEAKTDAKAEPKGDTKGEGKTDPKLAKKPNAKDKAQAAVPEAPKTEDERFIFARKTASEDPKVTELQAKADAAVSNSDAARLTRSYLKALYGKMRSLEPTLKERIDLTEAAALKLISEP